jgi:hypothetical protein
MEESRQYSEGQAASGEPNFQPRAIAIRGFERFGAARHPAMAMFVEELEFYEVLDGWYLGVVTRLLMDNDFGFAVLGPDEKGSKRWIAGGDSISSRSSAREQLMSELARFARAGKQVHRQD